MAEGQRRLLPAVALGGVWQNPALSLALRQHGPLLAVALLLGLISSLAYVRAPVEMRPIYDDSYISLTFATNLAERGKLSFDGETWSTGATSPLHVTTLAAALKLGIHPYHASIGVGLASHVALTASVYLLGWAIFRNRLAAILGAGAIAFTGYAALDSGNGLETSLFMALCALAVACYFLDRRPLLRTVTGVLVGLAVLTRPEGVMLMPALVIYRWIDRPADEPVAAYLKDAARLVVPGVLAGLAIALYSLAVSGGLGGTGSAKMQFFQEDRLPLVTKLSIAADQVGIFIGPVIPLLALGALVVGRRREALLIAIFWIPVLIVYSNFFPGGLHHYFYRYQHPTLPFIAAFAGAGAAYLIAVALQRDLVVKGLVVLALLLVVFPMYKQYDRWREIYLLGATETLRDLEGMALDLNTIVQPGEVLATHDIGVLGFFAHYQIIDLVGLVNEDVIPYHDGRRLSEYLDRVRPDYVLIFPDWDVHFLNLNTAQQPERYEFIKAYEGAVVRPQTYLLFRMHYD